MAQNEQKSTDLTSDYATPLLDIAEVYCLWKSMPSLFRYPPRAKDGSSPSPRQFATQMGIDDERMLELVEIPDQKRFAEKYKVHENTLTSWNREIVAKRSAHEMMRYWSSPLSKNVLMALYNNAIRKGMSFEVKLWFQLVEGWSEKTMIDHKHRVIEKIEYEVIESKHEDKTQDQPAAAQGDSAVE